MPSHGLQKAALTWRLKYVKNGSQNTAKLHHFSKLLSSLWDKTTATHQWYYEKIYLIVVTFCFWENCYWKRWQNNHPLDDYFVIVCSVIIIIIMKLKRLISSKIIKSNFIFFKISRQCTQFYNFILILKYDALYGINIQYHCESCVTLLCKLSTRLWASVFFTKGAIA